MKTRLSRVRVGRGGYEIGGRRQYWGIGEPLFRYDGLDGHDDFVRAAGRPEAKAAIAARYAARGEPAPTFFR